MSNKRTGMTGKERIKALLAGKNIDCVPIWPIAASSGFSALHCGASIADIYQYPEIAFNVQRKTAEEFGWLHIPFFGYASVGCWEFGGDIKWPSGEFSQAPSIVRNPVQTEEDAWNLKMPDVAESGVVPLQTEFYRMASGKYSDSMPFRASPYIGGIFTNTGNLCSVDRLSRWLIKKPDIVHHLLRMVLDYEVALLTYWKRIFGTEEVLVCDGEPTASNAIISPKQFQQYVLPYVQEFHEKVLAMGFQHFMSHICGEHNANLPYWAKIPMGEPGIISIGHETSLTKIAEYFPHDIIMGNLEPAIIQTKSADEVYAATKTIIEEGKKINGRYVFSTGCGLPPKAPQENVMAMTRAVEDYGWY